MHVLHLEDDLLDAELVARELARTKPEASLSLVTTRSEYVAALEARLPDMVLADYNLPNFTGLEALQLLRERSAFIPFIFVSGSLGEELAIDMLKGGATDYVLKSRLKRLGVAVERALAEMRQREERQAAERALDDQRRLLRTLIDAIPDAIYAMDTEGNLIASNLALQQMRLFEARDEPAEAGPAPPLPAGLAADIATDRAVLDGTLSRGFRERTVRLADGTQHWLATTTAVLRDAGGRATGLVSISRDITQQKLLERELLEVIGREQRRIGSDLHDDVGQQMGGIMMMLASLQRDLAKFTPAHAARVSRLHDLQRAALDSMRALARGLHPVAMTAGGLGGALADLLQQYSHLGRPTCRLEIVGTPPEDLEQGVAIHVFRIAQEALSNAVRHAGASEIVVRLENAGGNLRLEVTDNGRGTPGTAEGGSTRSLGFRLMGYRAQMVGGEVSVGPATRGGNPSGTRVALAVPIGNTPRPPG